MRYTARNGTTFLMGENGEEAVKVAGAEDEGIVVSVDLDDLREFVQYLEAGTDVKAPTDADVTAVAAD